MKKSAFIRILALMLSLLSVCCVFASCAENFADADNENASGEITNSPLLGELEVQGEYYDIVYNNGEHGRLEGELEQRITCGGMTSEVRAVADEGYIFIGWSDGKFSNPRKDINVKSDLTVTPVFKKEGTYFELTYRLVKGGQVIDEQTKREKVGKKVSYTAQSSDFAYELVWSDGNKSLSRSDTALADGKIIVGEYLPEFKGAPAICINTEDGLGIESRTEYKNCTVSVMNAEENQCFEDFGARIRGRGNSSWDAYPKKGFKLKFDNKVSMLGSPQKDKDWVFISNHGDKSLLRNMIGYDMSDGLDGLEFTMSHKFIDVYLNGEYYGLFMMCDNIEAGSGRIDIGNDYYSDPAQMGYIIEILATDPGEEGIDYFKAEGDYNKKYCIKLPDTDDPEYDPDVHLVYIEDYVDQCLDALSAGDWDTICTLIDIDSFVDYYIIQEMFQNKDALWRSIFFYKKPNGKLYAGPIWDLDQGAGNVNQMYGADRYDTTPDCDLEYVSGEYHKPAGALWVASSNTWYRRLFRCEEFKELVCEHLIEFGTILHEVLELATTDGSNPDSYYSLYGEAMNRNFERWKIMGQMMWPNTPAINDILTVSGQIDYMREWLRERYYVMCNHYGVST